MSFPGAPSEWAPDWFFLIEAARFLGVAPWELARQPMAWQQWALRIMEAKKQAQEASETMQRLSMP